MKVKDKQQTTYKVFISHAWEYHKASLTSPSTSPYTRIRKMLNRESGFCWLDLSITKDNPVPGPYRVKSVEKEIVKRIEACDVFILSEGGVYSGSRLWFRREFEIALTKMKCPKPILIVKPRGARFWDGGYASGADAWATWNRNSIIQGIYCLKNLSSRNKKALLAKGQNCTNCGNGMPALELNRLKGVYCLSCGQVTYLLSGEKSDQRWPDRSNVFWSNEEMHQAWSTLPKDRTLNENN